MYTGAPRQQGNDSNLVILFALTLLANMCIQEHLGSKVMTAILPRQQGNDSNLVILFALTLLANMCIQEHLGSKVMTAIL